MMFFRYSDLDAGDAAVMDAGAGVVIGLVGLELPSDTPVRSHLGFEVHPLREREIMFGSICKIEPAPGDEGKGFIAHVTLQ